MSENSTAGVSTPERLYTPVDELLTSAARLQQVRAASAAGDTSVPDDGPYTTRTNVVTAEYSDSRELSAEGGGAGTIFFRSGIVHRQPAISNKLAPKPYPNPTLTLS